MNNDRPNEPEDLPVPPRLAEALAALRPERVCVPPHVDETVLDKARQHLRKAQGSLPEGARVPLSPQRGEGRGEGCDRPWLSSGAADAPRDREGKDKARDAGREDQPSFDSSTRPSPRSRRRGSAGWSRPGIWLRAALFGSRSFNAGHTSPAERGGHGGRVRFTEKRRPPRRGLAPWLAAAACLALVGWLAQTLLQDKPGGALSFARDDVNGDGRVDILDALALARQIDRGAAGRFDLNGDGRVDQQDVQAVAARAVSLEGGS